MQNLQLYYTMINRPRRSCSKGVGGYSVPAKPRSTLVGVREGVDSGDGGGDKTYNPLWASEAKEVKLE